MSEKILENKYYLFLTEFFSGMAVMAVELGASRLLAPYFSSSQIVWTIIIGTIMIAMALGNIYGGKSADKNPNPDILYKRFLIAAVWIGAIPVLGKYIILLITGLLVVTIDQNFLTIAAFIACMLIFVFPLFLLGTVTPSLVKFSVKNLENNGKIVGYLGAFNTIGSIIGTFLPTFVTIPAVGTSITFLIFSGIILLLGLVYFISQKKKIIMCLIATILYLICIILGNSNSFAFWENNLVYEGESIYNYLQVKEDGEKTILSTNVIFGVQSVAMKNEGLSGMYYDYALAAPVMAKLDKEKEGDMLILGMGTGTYAKECETYFPNLNIQGIEIDQKITDISQKYFNLAKNASVLTFDGRAYIQYTKKKYDVIMVDAYKDITIPFQMSGKEFFDLVKEHLKENGIMVVNLNMASDREDSISKYLEDTIAKVFKGVSTIDVTGYTNRVLFAGRERDENFSKFKNYLRENTIDPDILSLMNKIALNLKEYQGGDLLLTDDKAPVEWLGMKEIDEIIHKEIGYFKEIFKRDGIKGLLEYA